MVRLGEGRAELYNLAEDIGESRDLASAQPAKLKELLADWEAWNRQLMPPRWQTQRQRAERKRKKA